MKALLVWIIAVSLVLFGVHHYFYRSGAMNRWLESDRNNANLQMVEYTLGQLNFFRGNLSGARYRFNRAIANFDVKTHTPDALYQIAKCHEQDKNVPLAMDTYREIIAGYPGTYAADVARKRLDFLLSTR